MTQSTSPIQAPFGAKCYGAGSIIVDKVGTVFQVWTGRLANPGPWGPHIWRTVRGGKPELVWFIENSNGSILTIMNKQLFFSYTLPNGVQWLQQIDGYVDPSDMPSSQVVDVDESALNAVKQSVSTARVLANNADYKALRAQSSADTALATADKLRAQLAEMRARLDAMQTMQSPGLNAQQVNDVVWAKLWDVVYLLRVGMNAGSSKDPNIQGWIHDLTNFIKKVK